MKRLSGYVGLAAASVMILSSSVMILSSSALPAEATTVQPLAGVRSVVGGLADSCAILTSGKVDCWGNGEKGALGNGSFYSASPYGSAVPVAVSGVGGTGTLGDVADLTSDGPGGNGYCALLTSGKVDCWGGGAAGQLGNGTFYTANPHGSAVPVAVKGVSGIGTLGDVASLTSDGDGYCALLTSSKVDCWGDGIHGQLGNATFYTSSPQGSAVPVAVDGAGGIGALGDVAGLTSDGDGYGYCALLTSGQADCWGGGAAGQLGNGTFYTANPHGSAVPVAVDGAGGTGTLTDVTSLTSDGDGYCALLKAAKVDCWGGGTAGQLGNGTFYTASPFGSAVPVAVKGVSGTGTLGNVASLTSDGYGYCALLTSGKVDCWGNGEEGALGNGTFYTASPFGSAVPVAVKGVSGTSTLGSVSSLTENDDGYCAILTSGQADCWGDGVYGQLGNGTFYASGNEGSALPVAVKAVSGTGNLVAVSRLVSDGLDGFGYCALLTSGKVDCWGSGGAGELGNGTFYTSSPFGSALPVAVLK